MAFSTASMDSTRMASAICFREAFSGAFLDVILASVTAGPFVGRRKKGGAPLYPDARAGSIRILEDMTRMDAASAAKDRVDRALALLERRLLDLKGRAAGTSRVPDDDLFAPRSDANGAADAARLAELEAAGREASEALGRAAEAVREVLVQGERQARDEIEGEAD